MHVWNVLHAAGWTYRTQKIAILAPSYNLVGLYLCSGCMYWQSGKNLLNIDTSPTCPRNMVNFGLLTAEISWRVWGTPANYCTALQYWVQPNFAALNRGRHLYSAGRPSRWSLAHISSSCCFQATSLRWFLACIVLSVFPLLPVVGRSANYTLVSVSLASFC